MNLEHKSWEAKVFEASSFATARTCQKHHTIGQPLPPIAITIRGREREGVILQRFYDLEQDLVSNPGAVPERYFLMKQHYYKELAGNMRKRKQFSLLPKLSDVLSENRTKLPKIGQQLIDYGITTLYLLCCEPERFLVGLKEGPLWLKVNLGDIPTGPEAQPFLWNVSRIYLPHLREIGRRELPSVPEKLIPHGQLEKVNLPLPAKSAEDLLEEAYFRQRYIVPPEGAEVRFRKAKDLEKLVLVESGNKIFAKVSTNAGEELVIIDLDTTAYSGPDQQLRFNSPQTFTPLWTPIVAETYKDLITAEEISTHKFKPLRPSRAKVIDEKELFEEGPQVIYIPRKVKVGLPDEPRIPYEGPPKPVKPHKVSGYKRRGNITAKHEKELREFEIKYDLKILDRIPAGFTWVRPYFVPAESGITFDQLPLFVKRRIETQLAQSSERSSNP